jgi:hypothetical protein
VFALVQKYMNVLFSVYFFLYMTCQLEITLYVSFQRCGFHIFFWVFQLMENLLPYSSYVEASYLQSLNVQILNSIDKNHPELQIGMFSSSLHNCLILS